MDIPKLTSRTSDGGLDVNFHPGQARAWESEARFVLVLAGTQSGKTSFGPLWFLREIANRGPGDYLIAAPNYPLLELKALPEFKRLFESEMGLGKYTGSPIRRFRFSPEGRQRLFGRKTEEQTAVYFGHAEDPDSLESATFKAAWLDECGQKKFKLGSWEAIQRRLSLARGRALLTTTPYDFGWVKQKLYDVWARARRDGVASDVDVIRFDSLENPAFSQDEFDRARATLPPWKFDLFYRAIYTRPAGMIYDSFKDEHKVAPFPVPRDWKRYLGLDFGGVNTAGVFIAEDPDTRRWYIYREYKAGGLTARQHAERLMAGEPHIHHCVGGSKSEDQWRDEFRAGGLPVQPPDIKDVEVGINRVYGAHANDRLYVFDTCEGYLDQKLTYSRELDDTGDPTEKIEDKETYHFMDAERYIIGWLNRAMFPGRTAVGGVRPALITGRR